MFDRFGHDNLARDFFVAKADRAIETEAEKPLLICGLDLAQTSDYSALAIIERSLVWADQATDRKVRTYLVRYLRRWRGQSYESVVADIVGIMGKLDPAPPLIVDGSGVGRPVVEMLRRARPHCRILPVSIVAGQTESENDAMGYRHVPKLFLVTTLEALIGATDPRRFFIAPSLELAPQLARELVNFTKKLTAAGNETYEAAKESIHDDLCIAVALACQWGERWGTHRGGLAISFGG